MGAMGKIISAVKDIDRANTAIGDAGDTGTGMGIKRVLGKSRTIASMAKDGVCAYPAIYSQGVISSNEKIPFDIAKYLEIQYAMFTMIAMGMNPIMDGSSVKKHVMSFYSEESNTEEEMTVETNSVKISVLDVSDKDAKELNKALEDSGFYEVYSSNYSRLDSSTEDKAFDDAVDKKAAELEKKRTQSELDSSKEITVKTYKISKAMLDAHPTMIDITLKMKNGTEVPITLAIKVTPHIIHSNESSMIFSRISEDKPLFTMARWMSGEISLFRDIILQMERAKQDKALYAKLGRHPWFRQLINRGGKRKVLGFLKSIPIIRKAFKNKNADILPICSLVVTKDEVVSGMNKSWEYFKKDLAGWNGVMDRLMLLCWAIYDTEMDTVEFVFNGLSQSEIIRADQLKKMTKDGAAMETEIIRNLSRKV